MTGNCAVFNTLLVFMLQPQQPYQRKLLERNTTKSKVISSRVISYHACVYHLDSHSLFMNGSQASLLYNAYFLLNLVLVFKMAFHEHGVLLTTGLLVLIVSMWRSLIIRPRCAQDAGDAPNDVEIDGARGIWCVVNGWLAWRCNVSISTHERKSATSLMEAAMR